MPSMGSTIHVTPVSEATKAPIFSEDAIARPLALDALSNKALGGLIHLGDRIHRAALGLRVRRQAIAANDFGTLGANTYRRCTDCIACEVTQLCQIIGVIFTVTHANNYAVAYT